MRASFGSLLAAALVPLATPAHASLAAGAAPAPQAAAAPDRRELVARLDSLARSFIDDAHAAGATVAVVRGSDTLLLRGYGERDRERHLPATATTVYRVGSITKQLTAAAVMQLVEQGRLSLADTLGRFLPAYPRWGHVTIRQLLTHTSGIRAHSSDAGLRARTPDEVLSPDSVLSYVKDAPFDFPSGTDFRYDNTGYLLLARVLELVTGRPHATLLRERFFGPLGMRSARRCGPVSTAADPKDDAKPYSYSGGALRPVTPTNVSVSFGGGDVCMDVPDFLRWQAAFTGGRIVSAATFAMMSSSDTIASGAKIGYGFGLRPGRLGAHPMIHHTGSVNGFSAQQLWFPNDSLRVAVFTNSKPPRPDPLAQNLAAAVLRLPLVPMAAFVEVPLAEADRARYTGIYDLIYPGNRLVPFRIVLSDEGLVGAAVGMPAQPLVYLGNDTFGAELDPQWRLRIVLENGRAVKAVRPRAGGDIEGRRRPDAGTP